MREKFKRKNSVNELTRQALLLENHIEAFWAMESQYTIVMRMLLEKLEDKKEYCKNKSINAILTAKIMYAEWHDIKIDIHADAPEKVRASNKELCLMIGSILQRGIDEAKRVKENERIFKVDIHYDEIYLYFNADFSLTKKDPRGSMYIPEYVSMRHRYEEGFMRTLTDVYKGSFLIEEDGDVLHVRVVIQYR